MPPARTRVTLLTTAALLLSVLLSGCAVGFETGGGDRASAPIEEVDGDSLAGDVRSAVGVTDAFWRQEFPDVFGRSYRSPRVEGGYRGENGPTCGGQPSVAFNAFYCPAQDFLAWDDNLMAAGYQQIGDAWVYLIIAHEWGHAIQAQLPARYVSPAVELQADCLAGAALQGAADQGLVRIEPGDDEEIATTLEAVADDYPWTDQGSHGNARQRIAAFRAGVSRGVDGCLSS